MESRERVKKKIQRAFIEMVKETPVESIQVKTLAQRAGISRSSFYVYYDSVWDVLEEVEAELFDTTTRLKQPVLDGETDESKTIFHQVIDYLIQTNDVVDALSSHGGDEAYLAKWSSRIRQQIALWRGVESNEETIQGKLLAEFAVGGVQRMLPYWARHKDELTKEETYQLFDSIMDGIRDLVQKP